MPLLSPISTFDQIHDALLNSEASFGRCLKTLNIEAILVILFGSFEADLPILGIVDLVADHDHLNLINIEIFICIS